MTCDLVRSVRGEDGRRRRAGGRRQEPAPRAAAHAAARRSSRCRRSSCSTCTTRPRRAGSSSTSRGLEAALGIPVRATVATRGLGIEGVTARARRRARARGTTCPMPEDVAAPALALLSGDERAARAAARLPRALPRGAPRPRRRDRAAATRPTADSRGARPSRARLGRLAVHPVWGWPILLAVLYGALRVRGRLRGRDARRPDGGRPLPRLPEPLGRALFSYLPWRLRARPVRRRVRPPHDGPLLRPRDRAADRGDLLHLPSPCSRTRATCRASR